MCSTRNSAAASGAEACTTACMEKGEEDVLYDSFGRCDLTEHVWWHLWWLKSINVFGAHGWTSSRVLHYSMYIRGLAVTRNVQVDILETQKRVLGGAGGQV